MLKSPSAAETLSVMQKNVSNWNTMSIMGVMSIPEILSGEPALLNCTANVEPLWQRMEAGE